ncbi:MAG: alpha amylase C-terminal domain-containing protein [Pygmaiobacter massiliensis]|nr:alpha amylase C-terminal domain-containing protein [Pygmaiobacter massiliensis]
MSSYPILQKDPLLKPYEADINLRMENYKRVRKQLVEGRDNLADAASDFLYYGFHQQDGGWYYRETAPGADAIYLTGDFNQWNKTSHPMKKLPNGDFELFLPGENALWDGCHLLAVVHRKGKAMERIPLYATYVVQDPDTYQWSAVIYHPEKPYRWQNRTFVPKKPLMIYECHIGMAQEKYGVGSYAEFKDQVLPRVKKLGYNTIQIMAIMEHPYYGSFGYQVSNFFAASSRFGTPDELKELIDTAHGMGIGVLLDVVHSHLVKNTREGISEFDGTDYQFSPSGPKGDHPAWGTRLFDYGKPSVLRFLLSNLRFWMEEYRFDGFRFDGVTSMLYHDHGLGMAFGPYERYFSLNTNTDAVTYLQLANELVHHLGEGAVTIAEDTSAMPGLCLPLSDGGIGFDYRMAMGEPDMWIKILKERKDEDWDIWNIWYELTGRRPGEPVIGYVESHDQALVGDKTIMFRLCDKEMYWGMEKRQQNLVIDRGMALHKMIRLVTMSLGGEGYLNFMGNEFGHPEWIDFPREGNNWSYHHCRRQWSLVDDKTLKFEWLNEFDRKMVQLANSTSLLTGKAHSLWVGQEEKVLIYEKKGLLFAFNFHPTRSFEGYFVPAPAGSWKPVLTTDAACFGGQGRIAEEMIYQAKEAPKGYGFELYLPSRTAVVLAKV